MVNFRDPAMLADPAGEEILATDTKLTNAQVLALFTTPVTLVPAPGAGLAIVVDRVMMFLASAGAYVIGTANFKVEYADGTDIIDVTEAGFIDQATNQTRTATPAVGQIAPIVNSAVRLNSEVANPTGGNAANTLSVRVFYRIAPAFAF